MRRNPRELKFESLEPRNLLAAIAVTTTLDVIDSGDGLLSLREAIIQSNSNNEDDVIQLDAQTYVTSIAGIYEDAGLTGDFDILSDGGSRLEIRGHINGSIIDGGALDRVFDIKGGSEVLMSNVTIRNGSINNEPIGSGRRGGGIKSTQSNLSLVEVQIRNNTSGFSGVGGGVWVSGGTYTIERSIFQENVSSHDGIALFARNSTGVINMQSGVFDNRLLASPSGPWLFSAGVVTVLGGSLAITGTKIDFNVQAIGIKVVDGILDADHIRILNSGNGIHAVDSQVTVHDSRFSLINKAVFAEGASDLTVTESFFGSNFFGSIGFKGQNLTVSSIVIDHTFNRNGFAPIEVTSGGNTNQQIQIDQVEYRNALRPVMVINTPGTGANVELSNISVPDSRSTWGPSDLMIDVAADHVAIDHLDIQIPFFDVIPIGVRVISDTFLMENSSIRDVARGTALDIVANNVEIRTSTFSGNQNAIAVHPAGPGNVTRISNTTIANGKPNAFNSPVAPLATGVNWSAVDSRLIIDGSTFIDNESKSFNAIVHIDGQNNEALIAGIHFEGNTSLNIGTIEISGSGHDVTVANSLFADNVGGTAGVFYVDATNSNLSIYSSTFARNLTTKKKQDNGGGGVARATAVGGVQLLITNSILIGNGFSAAEEDSHVRNDNGTTLVRNSDIVDLDDGDGSILFGGAANGNTDAKPIFVDYLGSDFRLKVNSPLRDIGNLSDLVLDIYDLDGDSNTTESLDDLDMLDRVSGLGLDLGAYEFPVLI